jgi:hypothetical protein
VVHGIIKYLKKIEKEKERIENKILTCPHCGLTGRNTNLRRYHFENLQKQDQSSLRINTTK